MSEISELLTEFGREYGLPGLCLDASGSCVLGFDDVIQVRLQSNEDGHVIFSVICGVVREEYRPQFALDIAEANFFWAGTGGATLGMDPATGTVVYAYLMHAPLPQYQEFSRVLESLVNNAQGWVQHLLAEPGDSIPEVGSIEGGAVGMIQV